MKRKFKMMLYASVILSMGLVASCSNDNGNHPEEPVIKGKQTAISLRLVFPHNTGVRATADPNATDAEAALKTVDVYIYTDEGDYLSHTALTASNFTSAGSGSNYDTYKATTTIPSSTGVKNIYAGVNLPSAAASSLEQQTLSHAATMVQTITRSEINVTNGLPMFSTAVVTPTLVEDSTANVVTVNVQRIVAKVTVEKDPAMVQSGVAGTLDNMSFAINNQNSKYYLLQGSAPNHVDPNWEASSYDATNFSAPATTDYVLAVNGPQSNIANYNAVYALENTSKNKTMKELTRVTVRATFIPSQVVSSYTSGGTLTYVSNPAVTPETFWGVTPGIGQDIVFFNNQTAANTYASDKGVSAVEYTGGYCYWNIFLNKSGAWDVLRNDYYKCNITRVVAPGQPTADLPDPNAIPQEDTSLTVDLNVLFWNTPILEDYELAP